MDILKNIKFVNKKEETFRLDKLGKKMIGLYFTASWSPPCQEFTEILANFNAEMIKRSSSLQIIYIPCDKSENDMKQYFLNSHGDWLAVKFDDPAIK